MRKLIIAALLLAATNAAMAWTHGAGGVGSVLTDSSTQLLTDASTELLTQ